MVLIAFDTLRFAKKLADAGMERGQAEAFAEAVRDELLHVLEYEAAKRALTEEWAGLLADMREMRLGLLAKIDEVFDRLFRQLVVLQVGVAGLIVALIKLLP